MANKQYIIIMNRSLSTYKVSIPFFSYVQKGSITPNSIFSLHLPFSQTSLTQCLLTSQNGKVSKFTLGVGGDIEQADPGLKITTPKNGLTGDFYGQIPVEVVQLDNTGLIIYQ